MPATALAQSSEPSGKDDLRTLQAAVTPPSLVQFVKAPYPADARAKGVEADVVLALDIDESGQVTAVEVVEPRGTASTKRRGPRPSSSDPRLGRGGTDYRGFDVFVGE